MSLSRSRLDRYPLTSMPTPKPRPRHTPKPIPTPMRMPALNHVSSPANSSSEAPRSSLPESWYSRIRSSYRLRTFRSTSARSNATAWLFHGTMDHGAGAGAGVSASPPAARAAEVSSFAPSRSANAKNASFPKRAEIVARVSSPREVSKRGSSSALSSSDQLSDELISSEMTHIASRETKLRGLVTFHAASSHSRVIARWSPAHVPTRHSSMLRTCGTASGDGVERLAVCGEKAFFSSPNNGPNARGATRGGTEASSSRVHPAASRDKRRARSSPSRSIWFSLSLSLSRPSNAFL
mmetsp:Transcript_13307/g.56715  ORF Transcript_13307/g.56715 Transcript_13307/m.56715 type:complete len:295 (-) Transcript_13307:64-948(-)